MKETIEAVFAALGAFVAVVAVVFIIYLFVRGLFSKKRKESTLYIFKDAYEALDAILSWYYAFKPQRLDWAKRMTGGIYEDLILMEKDAQEKEK